MTEQQFHALVEALAHPDVDSPLPIRDQIASTLVQHGVIPPSGRTEGNVVRLGAID